MGESAVASETGNWGHVLHVLWKVQILLKYLEE